MEESKLFETESGYCHILPDRLALTTTTDINSPQPTGKKPVSALLYVFNMVLAIALILIAIWGLFRGFYYNAGVAGVFGCTLFVITFIKSGYRAVNSIQKDQITDVVFEQTFHHSFESRFIIYVRDVDGKRFKRKIELPPSRSRSDLRIQHAFELMSAEFLFMKVKRT